MQSSPAPSGASDRRLTRAPLYASASPDGDLELVDVDRPAMVAARSTAYDAAMRFVRTSAAEAAAGPATPSDDLDPIAVFTVDGVSEGWTIPGTDRLSDDLNRGVPIPVRYDDDGPWTELPTESSVAIAAPPRARSANRIARRHHALDLTAPPYRIHGVVHMPHGADPTRYLRAAPQKWVAVTDSTIVTGPDGDGFEIDVLLVNMDYVARP